MKIFSQSIDYSLPTDNCAEISVFGPGIGECIVLHLGNGDWFIVDSCINPSTKRPVAMDYLEKLNVPKEKVRGILITHWHNDHTAGAARLVRHYSSAKIYMPAALPKVQAIQLAALFKKDKSSGDYEPIREYSEIIDYLVAMNDRTRLKIVHAGNGILRNEELGSSLTALSPSDAAVQQAMAQLEMLKEETTKKRVRLYLPSDPNMNAVALHFNFGSFSALLGSDLETTHQPDTGWTAVINSGIYADLSLSQSSFFKVAHHGSHTGHHDGIWAELLHPDPIAVMTSFSPSKLPLQRDINRVKSTSPLLGITKLSKAVINRDSVVEKEMKAVCIRRDVLNVAMGHIQLRVVDGTPPVLNGNEHAIQITR